MTPNSVKPLYLIINNANGYIKEYNGNIYLTLAANDESKVMLKKHIKNIKKIKDLIRLLNMNSDNYKSSHPEAFLGKGVLRICSKFTGEHPCRSAISIKLQANLLVNLLHIFRTPFIKNTSDWLLLQL